MLCPAPLKGGGVLSVVWGKLVARVNETIPLFKSKVCGGGTKPQCLRYVLRFMTVKERNETEGSVV